MYPLMLGLVFVCVAFQPQPAFPAEPESTTFDWSRYQLQQSFVDFGLGVAEALRGSGKRGPLRKQPNEHVSSVLDEICAEDAPGVHTEWLRPGSSSRSEDLFTVTRLAVTRQTLRLPYGLKIGKSRPEDVTRSALGPPSKVQGTILIYSVRAGEADEGDNTLRFSFRQGKLWRVEWEWFID
jgi:hypothetical protein